MRRRTAPRPTSAATVSSACYIRISFALLALPGIDTWFPGEGLSFVPLRPASFMTPRAVALSPHTVIHLLS